MPVQHLSHLLLRTAIGPSNSHQSSSSTRVSSTTAIQPAEPPTSQGNHSHSRELHIQSTQLSTPSLRSHPRLVPRHARPVPIPTRERLTSLRNEDRWYGLTRLFVVQGTTTYPESLEMALSEPSVRSIDMIDRRSSQFFFPDRSRPVHPRLDGVSQRTCHWLPFWPLKYLPCCGEETGHAVAAFICGRSSIAESRGDTLMYTV